MTRDVNCVTFLQGGGEVDVPVGNTASNANTPAKHVPDSDVVDAVHKSSSKSSQVRSVL